MHYYIYPGDYFFFDAQNGFPSASLREKCELRVIISYVTRQDQRRNIVYIIAPNKGYCFYALIIFICCFLVFLSSQVNKY